VGGGYIPSSKVGTRGTGSNPQMLSPHFNASSCQVYRQGIDKSSVISLSSPCPAFPIISCRDNLDSGEWYENECECGQTILDFCVEPGVSRRSILFSTKLKHNAGVDATHKAIDRSIGLCGLVTLTYVSFMGPGAADARRQAWEACWQPKRLER